MGGITGGIAVQVLAEEGGLVSGLLQAHADRVLLVPLGDELLEAPIRRLIAQNVVVVIVEAGKISGPRWAAYRVADEVLLKGGALLSQQGTYLGHLKGGGVVQIVGEDEDYIRPIVRRLRLYFLGRLGSRAARDEEEKDRQTRQDH